MQPIDFVFDQVVKTAMKQGVSEDLAKRHGDIARYRFEQNRFNSVNELIEDMVTLAKKTQGASK